MRTIKIQNEIYEIQKWSEKIKRKELIYKTNNCIYDFQQFETIRSFGDNVYTGKISIDEAENDRANLVEKMVKLNNKTRPKRKKIRKKGILSIM